jgi:hypothetical protein
MASISIVGAWQEYQGGADGTTLGCNTPLDKYRVVGALQVGRYRNNFKMIRLKAGEKKPHSAMDDIQQFVHWLIIMQ